MEFSNNNQSFNNEKSPLESLRERMKKMQSGAAEKKGQTPLPGFTIHFEEKEQTTETKAPKEDVHSAKIPKSETTPIEVQQVKEPEPQITAAADAPIAEPVTDKYETEKPVIDEPVAEESKPQVIETVAPVAEEPEHDATEDTAFGETKNEIPSGQAEEPPVLEEDGDIKENNISFLKRMSRFTTNDNGVDVAEIEEPLYQLETVDEILGIESEGPELQEESEAPVLEEKSNASEYEEVTEEYANNSTEYISDIDMPQSDIGDILVDKPATADTATIRFTPISDNLGASKLQVDKMTHQFDLSGEFTENQVQNDNTIENIEENEFEEYTPEEEIRDRKGEKKHLHKFALKKRNYFLGSFVGGILLFALVIFLLPGISANFYSGSSTLLLVSTVILGIIVLLNAEMFKSVIKAFKGDFSFDLCASAASLSTLALAVFSILNKDNCFPLILVCAFTLFIRMISRFYYVSNLHGNLKVIAVPRPKKAVYLINDDPTTIAMAKNSIEGKIMVASSRKTDRVDDFIKYSNYKTGSFSKSSIIIAVSLSLAVVSAIFAGLVKHSVTEAFYVSSAILCAAALPTAFLIEVLPLRSAASRLNRMGAMLTGYVGAEKINQTNAAVIKTEDIFPYGTVILKDMKVLSNSNVDDVLLRAASLTDAVSSPLSNIFKQIAKTNDAYDVPPSDTVKYEKRLGISGWVHDELMFIGNRTLLQAHGIDVPDLEFDREILKKGFFPVYVAMDNKACVLLIIKYKADPDVAKQLRAAADLGITLLVDNSDPNVTNEMICDYFDLYEDSVAVMNVAGSSAHRAATQPIPECSAPAAFRGNSMSLLQIMCSAARVKKSNLFLTVIYVIAAVIGIVYFIYGAFLGEVSIAERGLTVLIYELATTAISLAAFMIKKP